MIQQLLQIATITPLTSYKNTKDWFVAYQQFTKDKSPIDKAIIGGFTSQQLSFTFLAGYHAALAKMFPSIAPNRLKALCISEAKGNHPKSFETTLINNRITGFKTYITGGTDVEDLLVLCKTDQQVNGRPFLKMVHIPATSEHIEISNFELSFMQEIKHGKLALKNTPIESHQILDGDGYSQYAKPFRTLEDICISAAFQALLLRQAIDNQWKASLRDQLLLNIFNLKNLLDLPPAHQETILLVALAEQNFEALLPAIEQHIAHHATPSFQTDWARNKRVLSLSKQLKELRLAKARKQLFES
jgi:hypothetical protein